MMRLTVFVLTLALCVAGCSAIVKDVEQVRGSSFLATRQVTKDAAALSVSGGQVPDGVTETTSKSWFERMQDAMVSFCIGIVLIIFSVPVLWVNERRNARMQSLLARGESDVRTAKSTKPCEANEGTLVHVSDGSTKAMQPVTISAFKGAELKKGCLRLRTTTSVYQWVEKSQSKEKKNNVGGGSTKTTTYTYEKEWVTTNHDSSKFKEKGHDNKAPSGVQLGIQSVECSKVEYGDAFLVPQGLIKQMSNFVNAQSLLGKELVAGKSKFSKGSDGYFECPVRNGSSPEIGDARVKVEYVAEGPATIMALQAPCEEDANRHSFLPYRLYSRGLCGMREDQEKRVALKEGQKDLEDLADEDKCTFGPLACLCCACNLVTMFFSALTPQIYHIFEGNVTEKQCIKQIAAQNSCLTLALRVIGWLMMFIGLYALFSPLLTFVDIIPFLGPLISSFGGGLIWIACFLVTLAVASLIVCVAYLAYRPLLAMMYGAVVAACVAVPLYVIPTLKAKQL